MDLLQDNAWYSEKKKREFTLAKKRIMPSEKIPIALTAAIAAL